MASKMSDIGERNIATQSETMYGYWEPEASRGRAHFERGLAFWSKDVAPRLFMMTCVLLIQTACTSLSGGSDQGGGTNGRLTSIPAGLSDEFLDVTSLTAFTAADLKLAQEAQFKALTASSAGQPVVWRNPNTGNYGQATPGQRYSVNGLNCRDVTHVVFSDGETSEKRATACQRGDGSWRVLSS